MVERIIGNDEVGSSILPRGTISPNKISTTQALDGVLVRHSFEVWAGAIGRQPNTIRRPVTRLL